MHPSPSPHLARTATTILGVFLLAPAIARPSTLDVEGVHVVPHVQSTEMRYRQKTDFSLGARVEIFVRNTSQTSVLLPADLPVQVRGRSPDAWLPSDDWAWHDFPSAWGGAPLHLPPGALTVWSWNGKRANWGTQTRADLHVALPGDPQALHQTVPIDPPSAWISALTFLGPAGQARPDSLVVHIANQGPEVLRLDACRLWLPADNASWRALLPQPWATHRLDLLPADGRIAPGDRAIARVGTGPLPLTYAALEVRLIDPHGHPRTLWAHQRIKREAFDISGGWVNDGSRNGSAPLLSEPFLRTLHRLHVNTAYLQDTPGYTDQAGPGGLYARHPLKYVGKLQPMEHYGSDALLPRIHAVEFLGEPQYGGGRPVPPQEVWRQLSPYAPSRLPTSLTHSEERLWRFYAGLSDYPHYDAYRVSAPSPDAWGLYDRWNGQRIRWGAPLETIGEMSRSLRDLNRPRPVAYWAQAAHHDWGTYGGRARRSPTPDELRLQAYHALASRITSLYWFNLSARSLVAFPDLIEPMTRIGREIRLLEDYYLEGDATSHQRVLHEGKPDWDLDVIAAPGGALLFALDLAYQADASQRQFTFGPPREATFRFPLPSFLSRPTQVLRVDADAITPVAHQPVPGGIEVRDRASRVVIYLATSRPGDAPRLEERRRQLVAAEEALGPGPAHDPHLLNTLRQLARPDGK